VYLREIPQLLTELDTTISRQTSMHPGGGMPRCASPDCSHGQDEQGCTAGVVLEFDDRASTARTALATVVRGWARVWHEETPARPPVQGPACRHMCRHRSCIRIGQTMLAGPMRHRLLAGTVGQAALLAACADLGSRPWISECAGEIITAVHAGYAAIDRPPDLEVVGRCACGTALYAARDARVVACTSCHDLTDVADARAAGLAESRELVTATALAEVLGVPPGTVRSWVSRGRLVRRRCDLDGRPLYRVRDGAALRAAPTKE
jgi:hypothetical protein